MAVSLSGDPDHILFREHAARKSPGSKVFTKMRSDTRAALHLKADLEATRELWLSEDPKADPDDVDFLLPKNSEGEVLARMCA
jgi:hypothetical protein